MGVLLAGFVLILLVIIILLILRQMIRNKLSQKVDKDLLFIQLIFDKKKVNGKEISAPIIKKISTETQSSKLLKKSV